MYTTTSKPNHLDFSSIHVQLIKTNVFYKKQKTFAPLIQGQENLNNEWKNLASTAISDYNAWQGS